MAQRIALVPCINPAHKDDTPSMAVYDHGQKKLQVFCFGCKFHGWVTPSDIATSTRRPTKDECVVASPEGAHLSMGEIDQRVTDFFVARGITEVPWAYLTYGSEVFNNVIRPYFRWSLQDLNSNIIGHQTRFLDDKKPKIKTEPVGGKYPQFAWWNPRKTGSVRIVESWVDAIYLDKKYGDKRTLILLGTQHTKVDWYKFLADCGAGMEEVAVHLWFDGDKAGVECANRIQYILNSLGADVINNTVDGKKIYEF